MMKSSEPERVAVEGGWFDVGKAEAWDESVTQTEGISVATDSKWDHERLYRTHKHAWVIKRWSETDDAPAVYERTDILTAVLWLLRNGHDIPQDLEEEAIQFEI